MIFAQTIRTMITDLKNTHDSRTNDLHFPLRILPPYPTNNTSLPYYVKNFPGKI